MPRKAQLLLIGPTYPFRGGIAHHTTMLARALARRVTTTFVSFKRQYIRWLFPGKTDEDRSTAPVTAEAVRYELDTLSPRTFFRIGREARGFAAVVLPWWVTFWAPYYLLLLTAAAGKTRVVFVCHNVLEHEASRVKRSLARAVLRRGDAYVVQSSAEAGRLSELVGTSKPIVVSPHPTYDMFDAGKYTRASARHSLSLREDAEVVLFFGFIRPYKGLDDLLAAFELLAERRPRAQLLVVGECWRDEQRYREYASPRVRMILEYVPNEEVERYVKAADVLALPYLSGTGSGVAQIALAMSVPVVATRIGAFEDVVIDDETGYLVPPHDPGALAQALERVLDPATRARMQAAIMQDRDRFSWDRLAARIEELALGP